MTDIQKENKSGGKVPNRGSVNFPRLRFPEFEGEYRQYSFEDLFLFSTGKNIKQNEASPEYETPCVRYGELYHLYNEIISEVVNKTNLDKSDLTFSIGNEILLPSAGEDPLDIGSASALTIKGVAIGRTINILRPLKKNLYSNIYVSYYINEKLKKKISTLAKGVSISNVYNSDLKILNALLPSISEQQKISSFLLLINSRIQTQNKIINDLKTLKIATAKKIFSGELRFKDDNGNDFSEWEDKKLGDISIKKSSNISANTLEENQGNFKIYGANGLLKEIDFYREEKPYIAIVKDGAGVGRLLLCEGKSSVLGTLDIIKNKEQTDLLFLYYLLETIDFTKFTTGSTIPHIYFKDYSKEIIGLPSFPEQTKIANFLSSIDSKIDIENQLLQKLEAQKKYLLQNMFV
jgi:type I restriction enzyme S subunit